MTTAWHPPPKESARDPKRAGALKEDRRAYCSTVISFPRLTRCRGCAIQFRPAKSWHFLCRTCWHWSRAGEHIAEAARMLRVPER
jgi:hypothetical protein